MAMLKKFPRSEMIECPNCGTVQSGEVHFEDWMPFPAYVHDCQACGYTILESEWYKMETLKTKQTERDPAELKLGAHFDHVDYDWRAFYKRQLEHQGDYLRLMHSMWAEGCMTNPLIVFRDQVLIGMRRCEIARFLGWRRVPCWEIQDDITGDPNPERVFALRDNYQAVRY